MFFFSVYNSVYNKNVATIQHPPGSAITRQITFVYCLTNATDCIYKFGTIVQGDVIVLSCHKEL